MDIRECRLSNGRQKTMNVIEQIAGIIILSAMVLGSVYKLIRFLIS